MSTAPTSIIEPTLAPITGIWDADEGGLFLRFRVTLTFTNIVLGGVPQKPELIEAWLRQRITGGDEEVRQMMVKTLDDLGVDVAGGMSMEELKEAAKRVAAEQHGNTFRRDEVGLFLMPYQPKALLKEVVSMLYPYSEKANRMGPTSKAARAFWAERVFIEDHQVHLLRDGQPLQEPDGVHLQIGHLKNGPKGPRSTLTYYDFCRQPTVSFVARVLQDVIPESMWKNVLLGGQFQGIGALRSMEPYGRFKVTGFERL